VGRVSDVFSFTSSLNYDEALVILLRNTDFVLNPIYDVVTTQFRDTFSLSSDGQCVGLLSSNLKHIELVQLYNKNINNNNNKLINRFIKEGIKTSGNKRNKNNNEEVIIAFHGTNQRNINSIIKNGLDPHCRKRQRYGPGEYFSTNSFVAESYCVKKGGVVENEGIFTILVFALILNKQNYIRDRQNVYIVQDNPERQLPIAKVVCYRSWDPLPLEMRCERFANDISSVLVGGGWYPTFISYQGMCYYFIKCIDKLINTSTISSYSYSAPPVTRIWFALVQIGGGDNAITNDEICCNGFPNDTILQVNMKSADVSDTTTLQSQTTKASNIKDETWVAMVVIGSEGVDFVPVFDEEDDDEVSATSNNVVCNRKVETLVSMGFDTLISQKSLLVSGGEINEALDWIQNNQVKVAFDEESNATSVKDFNLTKHKVKIKNGNQILPLKSFQTFHDACKFRELFINQEHSNGILHTCFGSRVTTESLWKRQRSSSPSSTAAICANRNKVLGTDPTAGPPVISLKQIVTKTSLSSPPPPPIGVIASSSPRSTVVSVTTTLDHRVGGILEIFRSTTANLSFLLSPIYKFMNTTQFRNNFALSSCGRCDGLSSTLKHIEITYLQKSKYLIYQFIKEGIKTFKNNMYDNEVIIAFHGANKQNVDSIMKNGLDPKYCEREKCEYFSIDAKVAESYCLNKGGMDDGVFTILIFALIVAPRNYVDNVIIIPDIPERQLPVAKIICNNNCEDLPLEMRSERFLNDLRTVLMKVGNQFDATFAKKKTSYNTATDMTTTTFIPFQNFCPVFIKSVDNLTWSSSSSTLSYNQRSNNRSRCKRNSDTSHIPTLNTSGWKVNVDNDRNSRLKSEVKIFLALVQTGGDKEITRDEICDNGFPNDTVICCNHSNILQSDTRINKEEEIWVTMVALGKSIFDFVPVFEDNDNFTTTNNVVCNEKVEMLVAMGFDATISQKSLLVSSGEIDEAVDWILNYQDKLINKVNIMNGNQILPLALCRNFNDATKFRKLFVMKELSRGILRTCFGSRVTTFC